MTGTGRVSGRTPTPRLRAAVVTALAAAAVLVATAPVALAADTYATTYANAYANSTASTYATANSNVAAYASAYADSAQDTGAWQRAGRPDRLMVIRPGTVDLLSHGVLVRQLYPALGALQLSWLAANSGQEWISYAPGDHSTAVVRTAVLLSPGTTLRIGSQTKTVRFAAGTTAAAGSWIRGSNATLDIRDTTLEAVGPAGSGPVPGNAQGRPYLAMGSAGRMDLTGTTVDGFGRTGPVPAQQTGVTWGRGSTGSAVNSTFTGGRTGLRLAGSTGVRLDTVTVKDAVEDGVILDADRGTSVTALTSQGNGRNGLAVGGTDNRTLAGVTTGGNGGVGVKATAQHGLRLTGPVSHGDHGGGIRLVSCAACAVDRPEVDGAAVAVAVSGPGSQVAIGDPVLDHGATGISLAAGIAGATVTGGTVSGFERGIAVAGSHVTVSGTKVSGSATGIAVYGQASHVALRTVTVSGGRFGATLSGTTSAVTLTAVRISGASSKGLSSASPGLRVTGGSVSGATTAVDLGAAADLRSLAISGTHRGVHLATGVHVTARDLDVLAERKGIETDRGARLDLTDSRVRAPIALTGAGTVQRHGSTRITLPPFPWLGFAALAALTLAVIFQSVHQVRHRRTPRPPVAAHVRNTA